MAHIWTQCRTRLSIFDRSARIANCRRLANAAFSAQEPPVVRRSNSAPTRFQERERPSNTLQSRDTQSTRPGRPLRSTFDAASRMNRLSISNRTPENEARLEAEANRRDMESQLSRRWSPGDVYAPHDLSSQEQRKWARNQRKGRPDRDMFDVLRLNPLDHYKNFTMMSEFVTDMGRIRPAEITGLRAANQRKLAKAIKRAQGVGLMPRRYKHPELIRLKLEGRRYL